MPVPELVFAQLLLYFFFGHLTNSLSIYFTPSDRLKGGTRPCFYTPLTIPLPASMRAAKKGGVLRPLLFGALIPPPYLQTLVQGRVQLLR
jgi:hypothetical protein